MLAESHQGQEITGLARLCRAIVGGCAGLETAQPHPPGTNLLYFPSTPTPLGSPAAAIVVFLLLSSFFSSWFPEWRSHCQWGCLSGESSAPCPGPWVPSRMGWVRGQQTVALPPGLTGICHPASEQLWCSWKGLGLRQAVLAAPSHPSLKRRWVPPGMTCTKSAYR